MSTFALDTTSTTQNVIDAINYAVSNLGQGGSASFNGNVLTANTATGQITTTTTNAAGYSNTSVISYLYQFMDVKYANTATGGGFTSNCRSTQYYGLYNTNSTTIDTNPTDYIWYQVTNGFGTTKNLWYQTTGGRQVAFFAGNSAPAPNYIAVPDNTPLNLDSITSVQNNQIVNVNAYYQANTSPATPSGGTYNFSTFTLTPPAGWLASIPSTNSNTTVYVSQAAFVGNSISTVGPSTAWTTPAAYIQQFQGNTGPAGQRGFIPMGYVICSSDPAFFSNPTDYSNAFAAARTNASPPIGLGFTPIANDTAQFFYANLFSGVNTTTVRQFNGNIWVNVNAQVISGGLFVPGTITANTLNANEVYALTVKGGTVTPGVNSGYGYWLTANVGNAYFGGAVAIGNQLSVGQNAQIGANLNVGINTTIGANATIGDSLTVANNASIGNNLSVGTNATIGGVIIGGTLAAGTVGNTQVIPNSLNATFVLLDGSIGTTKIGNNAISTGQIQANAITAGQISAGSIYAGAIQANAVTSDTIAANAITTGKIAANAITGNTIQANTIQGTSIVAGSITSTQLSANIIISGNIISFGQTIESPTGVGYWLDYTNGNVYFGGNTVIGNSLKIGNNPNIGTGLTVGASAVIGNNLTVGQNAQVGANLNVGSSAVVGNNLTVGQNAQIGANLNVGSSLKVGSFATIGTNLTVQDNASIGNNLSVGTNATIGGVIIGGVIAANQVGDTQIGTNTISGGKITAGSIGTTQIGSNAITTSLIAANAITAGQIAAGSIYAGAIQAGAVTAGTIAANAVTAGTIAAGSVTAGTIAAGAIVAGTIGANAVVAGTIAAGAISSYSIQANSIQAGQVAANSIAAYNMQANSITGNNIQTNTITTTNLIFNSATGGASLGPTYPGSYNVPFYNNGVTNPTAAGYLWPYNTRGYSQGQGLSYIPTTSGNVTTNTRIVVVYSGYVFSGNAANLVELWKAGGSTYYVDTYNSITTLANASGAFNVPLSTDAFWAGGTNGYFNYSYNNGTAGTWNTVRSPSQSFYSWNNSNPVETLAGEYTYSPGSSSLTPTITWYSTNGLELTTVANTMVVNNGGPVANIGAQYGSVSTIAMNNYGGPLILNVGQYGQSYQFNQPNGSIRQLLNTGTTATLFSVDLQNGPWYNPGTNGVIAVAVGSNGAIVRNVYVKGDGQMNGSGWVVKTSGTINNLNSVKCNWGTLTGAGNYWVAVGDNGTILTSSDGNTWTARNSGTSQQLLGVTYGNGYWVAVGVNSLILYSNNNGVTWTQTQGPIGNDSVYRTLTCVTYGEKSNTFVAAGQAIVMQASASNLGYWSTQYDGGVSVASVYTRLASWGSDGSNIANVTVPALSGQLGSQAVSGSYTDYSFTANVTQTYYLVMGNLTGNAIQTNSATLQVTEFKR